MSNTAASDYVNPTGEFSRDQRYIATRITEDGRDGFPVLPGRYRLIVSRACPWANRAIIVRRLLGLEDALSMGVAGPTHDARSWTFDLDPGGRDPVLGIERLQEAFFARYPGYQRGITVPAIVDVTTGQVVTNDYPTITLDLSTQWRAHHRPGAPLLYPEQSREEIDEVNRVVFADVNNGVYRCGFAGAQDAYDRAYHRLFDRLDWLSARLSGRRYLVGDSITEADVWLFTTLVRFDAVYHGHFKCNRQKLTEMPVLWGYARDQGALQVPSPHDAFGVAGRDLRSRIQGQGSFHRLPDDRGPRSRRRQRLVDRGGVHRRGERVAVRHQGPSRVEAVVGRSRRRGTGRGHRVGTVPRRS